MRYCELIVAVGSALARSNGPDVFPATVITPARYFMNFTYKVVFGLIKGKRVIFMFLQSAPARASSSKEAWPFFAHFLSPQPKLAPDNELSLSTVTSEQILSHYEYCSFFDDILIDQRR